MASPSKRPSAPQFSRAKHLKVDPVQLQELPTHIAERFRALHALNDGWDSYGARAPSERALDTLSEALTVIADTVPPSDERIATMHVGPTSGGAAIEWPVGDRCLEVSIGADGSLAALRIEHDESDDDPTPLASPSALANDVRWLLG